MHINLVLSKEQTESIKQSLFQELTTKDLAEGLFVKMAIFQSDIPEVRTLKNALMDFLKAY